MNFKSIKWRLQAWHGFLLVLLVVGLMSGFYTFERQAKLQAVDAELQNVLTVLLPKLAPVGEGRRGRPPEDGAFRRPPPGEGGDRFPGEPENGGPREFRPRPVTDVDLAKFYYASWSPDKRRIAVSTNAPAELSPDTTVAARTPGSTRTVGTNRERSHQIPNGFFVVAGTSLSPMLAEMRQLAVWLVIIGSVIVVVGLGIGWWLAASALRPIEAISRTAEEIAGGDLSKRIDSSETESELGQLAVVLNSTFARLDAAFEQQRQFTSDAAHELRTPVSVLLTQTQSTLTKERTAAEYRETLEACQRAAQRMRRLIESLLELARIDAGQESMKRIRFDLANTTRESIEMIRPLAEERRITIRAELFAAGCHGDSDRIAQVLMNLLTNAVHHNKDGGEIRVTTKPVNGSAVLIISDNGPGIAPEQLPHVFKRFYRADAARTSSQGRSGLGLAISAAIVHAHGGSIEAESKVGEGSSFIVRLPMT